MEKSLALLFLIQLFIWFSLKLISIIIISNNKFSIRKKTFTKQKNEINNLSSLEGKGRGQWFCDNSAKTFIIKNVTIGWGGSKIASYFVNYRRSLIVFIKLFTANETWRFFLKRFFVRPAVNSSSLNLESSRVSGGLFESFFFFQKSFRLTGATWRFGSRGPPPSTSSIIRSPAIEVMTKWSWNVEIRLNSVITNRF